MKYEVIVNQISDDGAIKEVDRGEGKNCRIMLENSIAIYGEGDETDALSAIGLAYKLFPDVCDNIRGFYNAIQSVYLSSDTVRQIREIKTGKKQPIFNPEGEAETDEAESQNADKA